MVTGRGTDRPRNRQQYDRAVQSVSQRGPRQGNKILWSSTPTTSRLDGVGCQVHSILFCTSSTHTFIHPSIHGSVHASINPSKQHHPCINACIGACIGCIGACMHRNNTIHASMHASVQIVPRNDWRKAQQKIDMGMDQWVSQWVCPSATMWDEVSHTCHLMHVMHLCHAFCDLMVQEWDESYHYLVPIPDELETYMEAMPFLRMCNCTQFWHYARCVHVLMYTIMNLGRGCVPRGEDIRLVAPRAGRGTHTCIYSL